MRKITITLLLVMISTVTFAQKFKDEQGDLSILKRQEEVNLEFNYSKLKIFKENISEAGYITRRKEDINNKAKINIVN